MRHRWSTRPSLSSHFKSGTSNYLKRSKRPNSPLYGIWPSGFLSYNSAFSVRRQHVGPHNRAPIFMCYWHGKNPSECRKGHRSRSHFHPRPSGTSSAKQYTGSHPLFDIGSELHGS